jgi:hypothetical protein
MRPGPIILGDMGEGWSYARLNAAFRQLLGGCTSIIHDPRQTSAPPLLREFGWLRT